MATIGKNATEIEKAAVPRGLVHQRRALFARETITSVPNYSTPLELPSTSAPQSRRESLNERELIHFEQRRHLSIEVTRLQAPADLVRRSPDDDVSQLQRRVVLVRNPVNQEPTITVNEVRGQTPNHRTLSVNRVFPIVSIRVGEQAVPSSPHSDATDWHARAPSSSSIFRTPGSGPVHKNFSSTPSKLNEIRPVERIDTISYNKRPITPPKDYCVPVTDAPPPVQIVRKTPPRPVHMDVHVLEKRAAREIDDIYRRDDEVENEIARKEAELEKAKLVINQLSHDLEKLEKDRKGMEDSVIEEEDLNLSELEDGGQDNDREKKVLLDAEEILRECNRMMIQLQEEEETDQKLLEKIQRGESSEEEIQLEILRLQKQGSRRSKEDTSQIVSLKDQAVMFSAGGAAARQEALISRLERELTDAQTCNHRLNAQLGTLANNNESTLKKEYTELNKTLKERNDELDQLRKKVQKAEKDRQQWDAQKKQLESKLPVDVQLLLAQKKELTLQLDREQTEKHELFMQINHYIAQLAESGDSEALKDEMNSLQKRYKELQERSALLEQDLSRSKTEADVIKRSFETEKRHLQAEADDARKELDMKAAALQSLMLAKQDNTRLEMLTEENKRMQTSVEELQTSLREAQVQMAQQLTNKLDQFHTNSSNAAQEDLQRRLEDAEIRLKAAHEKAEVVDSDKKQLQQALDNKSREISAMNEQIRDAQQELQLSALNHKAMLTQLQSEMKESQRDGDDDLKKLLEKEKILQTTLDETSARLDATKVALLSAESRAVQAETDLKALDTKALNAERRVLQLQEQLSAAGNEEKEMELLRDQLRRAEERHEALLSKHQKTEYVAQETSNAMRMQFEELQQRLDRSERDRKEVVEKQTRLEDVEKDTSQKLSSMEQLRHQLEQERDQHYEKLQKMEKDLEQARAEKQSQKVSVAEEITTLTTMTASLRSEISQYQDQISHLEHEIHDLKGEIEEKDYENEQLIKELEQARAMADTERQTFTLLKSSQQAEEENVSKIKADLAHEKEARKKAETELATKFGAQLEEVTKEKTKMREEKTHIENELIDLRQRYSKLEEEFGAHKSKSMEDEVRLRAETSRMQTGYSIMEDGKKELEERVKEAENAKEELEQRLEKKLRESKEETEAVRREVESQKVRVRELEEERTRELGSNDEEKKKLLEELRFYREKADTRELEVENLKAKITSSNQEVEMHHAKSGMLQTRLENLQAEYEEMKQVLHSTEESAEKMKESEQMAAKIKRQLEEIESEHREKLREELTRREELERKIDELTAHTKHQEVLLVASSDTQKDELESAQIKVVALETRLAQSSKAQADLLQNVKNLTALVESESKRIEETAAEKRKWQSKTEELERQLEHGPHNEEMNRLVTENARLAGDLLTLRAQHAEYAHQNSSKDLEDQLHSIQRDNQRLAAELDNAKTRSEELNRSIVQADRKKREEVLSVQRELDRERQERERLQEKIDNMYSNGHSSGPNRTLSNMSAITSMTTQDFTEIDDVDQLHKMMDKQQRIIKVLRRKLLKLDQQQ